MPKWLIVPAKTASNKTATMKINFQAMFDPDTPEIKELIEAIGQNQNYYMTAMPFPDVEGTFVRGKCDFFNAAGVHLDGDEFFGVKVFGCIWGWPGGPQSVTLYGTFQIGTFCQSGYGKLTIDFYGKHLDGLTLSCQFQTIYREPKK